MNSKLNGMVRWSLPLALLLISFLPAGRAAGLPESDQRAKSVKTLNTLRAFPAIKSQEEWQKRAKDIRTHILVSCGLWPLPEKTPLQAHIFGKIDRDGYSVEKVYFQTYPGFYLAGNLYRPLGKGQGPFPGILNPHGHWGKGRLEDTERGSIPARCITFARLGMVAFSYDMVGYNDTAQVNHKFANDPTNLLWNISLMGLQTWNSIRALDFLELLPDVDRARLACTGASGGGTQTFMLGAIEDRLAAQAPNVMVSHSMQGGCLCENAPGLRVDYSNMEIAAVPAPRPQILVAAATDWTKTMMTIEGPAVQSVYRLFGAPDHLRFVRFEFDHNYNQTSREAVYQWFAKWLLHHPDAASLKEPAYQKEPDDALRVWPDGKRPADALNERQLTQSLVERAQQQWRALQPKDEASLAHFKTMLRPAWQHSLQLEFPVNELLAEAGRETKAPNCSVRRISIGRPGKGDRLPVIELTPPEGGERTLVVLAHPEGHTAFYDDDHGAKGLAAALLQQRKTVLLVDTFLTGDLADAKASQSRNELQNFFCTYNRTDLQERVQDLITVCTYARRSGRVVLCGSGRAGLWALLAAPAADAVVADAAGVDANDDATLLGQDLFAPGLRRIGTFAGGPSLAAPHPLLLHNTGQDFGERELAGVYAAAGHPEHFRAERGALSPQEISQWIAKF